MFNQIVRVLENSTLYYVIITNMEGKYSYVNRKYNDNFAGIYGDIIGKPYEITMHPDDTDICIAVGAKCFAHPDQIFPAVIRKHDGNGGYVITQWEYKAMFKENGEPDGVFCLGYDITESQNKNKQLLQAMGDIAQQQDLLNTIAFDQSHVIRKPVANILGLGLILDQMEIEPSLKEIIELMIESTKELDVALKKGEFNIPRGSDQ